MNIADEAWDSTKAYIKDKTNPFLATLIAVWIIQNWKPVYAFFFFGKSFSLEERINWFDKYWNGNFLRNLGAVIVISVVVLIITLILINLSKLITKFFADRVTPWVYKIIKLSNVIEREKYDEISKRNSTLEKEIVDQRDSRIKAEREKEELERNFQQGKQQLIEEGKMEAIKMIQEFNSFDLKIIEDFFKEFSSDTPYGKSPFHEKLVRYDILAETERDNYDGRKYLLTRRGERFRSVASLYRNKQY